MHYILCVDDEPSVLRALRRLFMDEAGYEVEFCESAREALVMLQEYPAELILSDYRMPEMDGVAFLKEARAIRPDALRIILSGYAEAGAIVSLINEGEIYKFIPKPWEDSDILQTIRRALEQHELMQENRLLSRKLMESNEELRRINEELELRVEERSRELVLKSQNVQIVDSILDQLDIGVIGICDIGEIVLANRRAYEFLGAEGRPLIGQPIDQYLPAQCVEGVERMLTTGEMPPCARGKHDSCAANGPNGDVNWKPLVSGGLVFGAIMQLFGPVRQQLQPEVGS